MKPIEQTIQFKATPDVLYNMYMNAKKHAALIGQKVSVQKKVGSKFSAFDGWVIGKTIALVPNKLIIQQWRGKDWNKSDIDSTLILTFSKKGRGTELHMVHANVPAKHRKSIVSGWRSFYWNKWKKALEK